MFSVSEFIEASRQFVCVRLETYESAEHEALIRDLLGGRYANTAFVVFAPDGKTHLTRVSRSAKRVLGATGRGPRAEAGTVAEVVAAMGEISSRYERTGNRAETVLQDFHTFRQALNVASGDQRLLVYVVAPPDERDAVRTRLRPVFEEEEIMGRFHLDVFSEDVDEAWAEKISGASSGPGIHVIRADAFGQSGSLVGTLPLDAERGWVKSALLASNADFAASEKRKIYSTHVREGRRVGIHFETAILFGEDRDGDGQIDRRR